MSIHNRQDVAAFFRAKGLHDAAIAGILGNLMVESGFNPSAYNAGEGAIGLAQWEGGRRTALQNYARQHGGSETDLYTQLNFLWHELSTSYSHVLDGLRHAGTAEQAAAIFDVGPGGRNSGTGFENSSGDATGQRQNYASQFYTGQGPNPAASSSGASGSGGTDWGSRRSTYSALKGVDGLGNLLSSVPALKKLVDQATSEGWTLEQFQNKVEDSAWYKNHSSTARGVIAQQANDPASYQQALTDAKTSVSQLSHQLGMSLTAAQLEAIANHALLTGHETDQPWLSQQIGAREDYSHLTDTGSLHAGMANTVQQLQQMSADYGFNWTPSQNAQHAQQILMGNETVDTYKQKLISWAKSAFPSLSKELDNGSTVKDLSAPYVQSMSNLLEVDPGTLNVYTPLIRKALQGTRAKPEADPTAVPLWQFEQQVREDPRWQYTQNAKQQMASSLVKIGQDFGYGV